MKIYVGCAITTVPEDKRAHFINLVKNVKNEIRDAGHEVLEFRTALFPNATAQEVYTHDIRDCVEAADAMLAICDHPSTGLGYEMAVAIEKQGIPVVAVAHTDSEVTKLVLGINHPEFIFKRYTSVHEISSLLLDNIA